MKKLLLDYIPIICFFIAFLAYGIYVATAVAMGVSVLQVLFCWVIYKKVEKIYLMMMCVILVLGAATLIFHNPIFVKWKPTIIYWIFATTMIGSQFFGSKEPIASRLMANQIKLPNKAWENINIAWAIFFIVLSFLNLAIAYNFDTRTWVYFKFIGTLVLTLLFAIGQAIYMNQHIDKEN